MDNAALTEHIRQMQAGIERGMPFTEVIKEAHLFTVLEIQVLAVGEKNGEIGPALKYISDFNQQDIEYQLKKINDTIGPILIAGVSSLVLIMALGVYLPIWNMVDLVKSTS